MFQLNSWGIIFHCIKVQGEEKMWHSNPKEDLYTIVWEDNSMFFNIILSTLWKKQNKRKIQTWDNHSWFLKDFTDG